MPRNTLIQWRQGTAAQWTSANPVLASGEPAMETDTLKWKLGNGSTAWTSLAYHEPILGPSQIQAVRKTADTTVNNVAVIAPDPELSIPVVSGGVYHVEGFLIYSSATAADLSIGWTYPTASTMDWSINALISTATGSSGSINRARQSITGTLPAGGTAAGAGSKLIAMPAGIFTAAASGNLVLNWSQVVADVSDTVIYANSTLKLTKLN